MMSLQTSLRSRETVKLCRRIFCYEASLHSPYDYYDEHEQNNLNFLSVDQISLLKVIFIKFINCGIFSHALCIQNYCFCELFIVITMKYALL